MTATPIASPDAASRPRAASPRALLARVRRGELEGVQVAVMLAVIWTVFALLNDRFLTPVNLTNLALQIAAVGLISVGVVLVLLLGEVDLSVGAVSGFAASIVAVLNVQHGVAAVPALLAGLGAGALIGLFQGAVSTRFAIPTFVVTLAGLIGWQGAQLAVLGESGTINLDDPFLTGLTSTFLAPALGWACAAGVVAAYGAALLLARASRAAAGRPVADGRVLVARVALVAAIAAAVVATLNADRGVPVAGLILVGVVAGMDVVVRRSRFGRRILAVGGNPEAARRAGIPVARVRIAVFALASTLAAAGGILAASRLLAANQSSGGGDLLLLAIAGPVVAGTSLFGGRGSVWSALTGALVIGSISNGMDLLGLQASVKFMVTGGVLLLTVVLDASTRMRRTQAGAR
jgi:D-xylose transport system permease protein